MPIEKINDGSNWKDGAKGTYAANTLYKIFRNKVQNTCTD